MTYVALGQLVVIAALLGVIAHTIRGHRDQLLELDARQREERFQLQERIRRPEQRPPRAPRRRGDGEVDGASEPRDLAEYARIGTVAPPLDDNEAGVAS